MSGNWSGTYESFLSRCLGGVRKEQEAFRELAKVMEDFKALEERGNALGLQEGWVFEGAKALTASYQKGKEAFDKEGDVYAMLAELRPLARLREDELNELRCKREEEEEKEVNRRKRAQEEAEKALRKAEKALREAENAVAEAAEMKKMEAAKVKEHKEQNTGSGFWPLLVFGLFFGIAVWQRVLWLVVILLAILVVFYVRKKGQAREMKELLNKLAAATKKEAAQKEEMEKTAAMLKQRGEEFARLVALNFTEMVPIPGKNYMLGKYPVTQAQWERVMGANPSKSKGADYPVGSVSWNDCHVFLEKLNALPGVMTSGLLFRLPTGEEWEFACRAGATGKYCRLADGTEITADTLGQVAWFEDNSGGMPHPVGQKKPNAFGLYDMLGNVVEMVSDEDSNGCQAWGGGWDDSAETCSGFSVLACAQSRAFNAQGFRLAMSLPE